jgi:hypothetical protein
MEEKVNLFNLCLPPEKGIDQLLSKDATVGEALLQLCLHPERFTELELKCLWEICAYIHGFSSIGTFADFVNTHFIKEETE